MKAAGFGVPLKVAAYVLAALLLSFSRVAAWAQQVVMFSDDAARVHSQLFICEWGRHRSKSMNGIVRQPSRP